MFLELSPFLLADKAFFALDHQASVVGLGYSAGSKLALLEGTASNAGQSQKSLGRRMAARKAA
jgi:hypothetical protein